MYVSMQGNWTVTVKSKSAAFAQRFVISGATSGNGIHSGTPGTSVNVTGNQWSITIQNDPGTGFQASSAQIKFPTQVAGNYEFEIWSDDAAGDGDFNDLILTCSTTATINDFLIYGHVKLYSGSCIFNPCWSFGPLGPWVIETPWALEQAMKNDMLANLIKKLYPERVNPIKVNPNPPDPAPFKPIVIDLAGEAMKPKTTLTYKRNTPVDVKASKSKKETTSEFAASNFSLVKSSQQNSFAQSLEAQSNITNIASVVGSLIFPCTIESGVNLTLSFEEYDRSAAELAGGAYTGTGNRDPLGNAITDMFGNYIFRFSFDMTFPGIADSTDIAPGEDINTVAYPDVIVKILGTSPMDIKYESAPYYNIPNLKRIDICLPSSVVKTVSGCHNGNLIGSLGNVFIGGTQNTTGSTTAANLQRYGVSNFLDADGKITVGGGTALFSVDCAAWDGTIDFKGCMYDATKSITDGINKTQWYTIRIRRQGTTDWNYVSQNYKHPKFHKENNILFPNYIGDDVGPFYPNVGGVLNGTVPAYINIQRESIVGGVNDDWEFSNIDRYMQLDTTLYDLVSGVRTPGTFYVRVDCYDGSGNHVTTDLIALYIHNVPLNFALTAPALTDPGIVYAGCGLYRLNDLQLNTPMQFSFEANDPYGFVDSYTLNMYRCPSPTIALQVNAPGSVADTVSGEDVLTCGNASSNNALGCSKAPSHTQNNHPNSCPGYTGTTFEFSNPGLINVELQPAATEGGWIKAGEYFTIYSFGLTAYKRVTNGYNTGLSGPYYGSTQILMERIS